MMDFPPEYAADQKFVFEFLEAAPELMPAWEEYAEDEDEFIPTSAMYDLARGIVTLVNTQLSSPNDSIDDALKRIFAFLETGMEMSEDGPIPNLIRLTMCDWLGRQSEDEPVYNTILAYIGPKVRRFLVTADERMPFRNEGSDEVEPEEEVESEEPVRSRPPAPLPVLQFDSGEELEIVHGVAWSFTFYRFGTRYLISVVCGGAGLYDVAFELNAEEFAAFKKDGNDSIIELAKDVNSNPSAYMERKLKIPHDLKMQAIEKSKKT